MLLIMLTLNQVHHGDCLDLMGDIPDRSIDAIICDLPFGTTACHWDTIIPFEPLWLHYKRIIKPRGAIVLFGSQPFTSKLVMSNLDWFKYESMWDKVNKFTGALNASHRPMKAHENILIFSKCGHTFNPQKTKVTPYKTRRSNSNKVHHTHAGVSVKNYGKWIDEKNPSSIIKVSGANTTKSFHPTQKPTALLAYLIRTYTNAGDLVLDNCIGSGSTAIAAIDTGRNWLGIEKDTGYVQIARDRIAERMKQPFLPELVDKPVERAVQMAMEIS